MHCETFWNNNPEVSRCFCSYKKWTPHIKDIIPEYEENTHTMDTVTITWILLSLFVTSNIAFGDFEEINRLNYGVYMTKRKDVTLARQAWRHTVILEIPTLTDFGDVPLPNCEFDLSCTGFCLEEKTQLNEYLYQRDLANTKFCPILRNETMKLNEIRSQYMASIKDSIVSIKRLIAVIAKILTLVREARESR